MSVIPLIISKTVVLTRNAFQQDGIAVLIENIDSEQAQDLKNKDSLDSNTSYDLTIGEKYTDIRDMTDHGISKESPIILPPGSSIIIETAEYVNFPKSRFGHIVPKVSMLHKGISNTSSKIDPGYYGKLSISVFNLSGNKITLHKGERFCTLYILDVADGVRPYQKAPKERPPRTPRNRLKAITDFFKQKYEWIIPTIISILALGMSIFK